jgi:hypothetical protein
MIGEDLTDLDMRVSAMPYDKLVRPPRQGAAVGVGTLPFDPRVEVRRQDGS